MEPHDQSETITDLFRAKEHSSETDVEDNKSKPIPKKQCSLKAQARDTRFTAEIGGQC